MMSVLTKDPIMENLAQHPQIGIFTSICIILINLIGTMTPLITFSASIGGLILIILTIVAKVKEIQKTNLDIKNRELDIKDHEKK